MLLEIIYGVISLRGGKKKHLSILFSYRELGINIFQYRLLICLFIFIELGFYKSWKGLFGLVNVQLLYFIYFYTAINLLLSSHKNFAVVFLIFSCEIISTQIHTLPFRFFFKKNLVNNSADINTNKHKHRETY